MKWHEMSIIHVGTKNINHPPVIIIFIGGIETIPYYSHIKRNMFQVSPYLRRRWDLFQDHRLHGRDFGLLPEVQLPQETRWWPSELKLMTIDEIWLKRWRLMGCRLKSKWRKIKKKSRLVGGIPPPLKNMKVSCNIWKIKNVPNHQAVEFGGLSLRR